MDTPTPALDPADLDWTEVRTASGISWIVRHRPSGQTAQSDEHLTPAAAQAQARERLTAQLANAAPS